MFLFFVCLKTSLIQVLLYLKKSYFPLHNIFINYKGKIANSTVEKSGRHLFNQMLKVNVTRKGTNRHLVPLDMYTEKNNITPVSLAKKFIT